MLFARITLHQAEEALRQGQLDRAWRLLRQPEVRLHPRSWELRLDAAAALAERGRERAGRGETAAAWADVGRAEELAAESIEARSLRDSLTRSGLADVRRLLEQGEPGQACQAADALRAQGVNTSEVAALEDVGRVWQEAREQAAKGEMALATAAAERAVRLCRGANLEANLAVPEALDGFVRQVNEHREALLGLVGRLHEAVAAARWRDILDLTDRVLALAPEHAEARRARAMAWKAVEPKTVVLAQAGGAGRAATRALAEAQQAPTGPSLRLLLWVDGVGGYLVCLGSRVTFGQGTMDGGVDVPLLADVSRLHAAVTRDAEGYVFEAIRPSQVNGQAVERALLRPGDRVTLGPACQFVFRQPAPVSASARLDLVSGHRLAASVDGVLLMAETLVIGPGPQAHVEAPDMRLAVVLHRYKDGLAVRCAGKFAVNGQEVHERSVVEPGARVVGEDFSLALEAVENRSV